MYVCILFKRQCIGSSRLSYCNNDSGHGSSKCSILINLSSGSKKFNSPLPPWKVFFWVCPPPHPSRNSKLAPCLFKCLPLPPPSPLGFPLTFHGGGIEIFCNCTIGKQALPSSHKYPFQTIIVMILVLYQGVVVEMQFDMSSF